MAKTILLVDDAETVRMFEKMMLAGQGYNIKTAKNGREAVDKVNSERPDLILLDIMMPEMNGIEACQKIKENPDTHNIPVVMVTTKGEPELVEKAFMAGCNDYLTKPVQKIQLLAKIKSYLG